MTKLRPRGAIALSYEPRERLLHPRIQSGGGGFYLQLLSEICQLTPTEALAQTQEVCVCPPEARAAGPR